MIALKVIFNHHSFIEHSNMLAAVQCTEMKPINHSIYLVCNIVQLLHKGPGTCLHSAGALL